MHACMHSAPLCCCCGGCRRTHLYLSAFAQADKEILANLKDRKRLIKSGAIKHSYPFCWRSDTPLIYRAVPSWFVKVESIKERLLACNAQVGPPFPRPASSRFDCAAFRSLPSNASF